MRKPKEIDVDAMLNDPASKRMQDHLRQMAANRLQDTDEDFADVENDISEDEEFTQPSLSRSAPRTRGPIANKMKADRIKQTEARLKERGLDPESLIRRNFDPDREPEEKEQPQRQIISNRPNRSGAGNTVDKPEIGIVQKLQKQLDDVTKKLEDIQRGRDSTVNTEEKPVSRLISRRKSYDSNYEAVMPPSQCRFYTFKPEDLLISKINLNTQIAITAARRNKDISAYIDALGATFKDVDIRDLTNPDWFYILYWHKFHSYPRSSLNLRWESKYGNENVYKIEETDLKFVYPAITKEYFLQKYDSKGLCVPTLRDWELLNTPGDLTSEDRDVYLRAQYFKGDTLEEKVDHYFDTGMDLERLELIGELNAETNHGVIDTVDVIDAKFDATKYMQDKELHLINLRKEALRYRDTPVLFSTITAEADEVEEELKLKKDIIKNGGQVRAEVETQPVRFNALDIFPFL